MGSGMLPTNAYVTLEHEYILIFRKGAKREFSEDERKRRYASAFFWEERNTWFSDVWLDLTGSRQEMQTNDADLRTRSAAYPLELAKRLILMFSIYGDTILDPFWGTGTTTLAAMLTARNSLGYEISKKLVQNFKNDLTNFKDFVQKQNEGRLAEHLEFVDLNRGRFRYENEIYNFPVMTSQEIFMHIYNIMRIQQDSSNKFTLTHIPCEP